MSEQPKISARLTEALKDARELCNQDGPKQITLPADVYDLLYHTALNARNRLQDLGE
jgi:hypothetical protein